jgi:hypothetical protein
MPAGDGWLEPAILANMLEHWKADVEFVLDKQVPPIVTAAVELDQNSLVEWGVILQLEVADSVENYHPEIHEQIQLEASFQDIPLKTGETKIQAKIVIREKRDEKLTGNQCEMSGIVSIEDIKRDRNLTDSPATDNADATMTEGSSVQAAQSDTVSSGKDSFNVTFIASRTLEGEVIVTRPEASFSADERSEGRIGRCTTVWNDDSITTTDFAATLPDVHGEWTTAALIYQASSSDESIGMRPSLTGDLRMLGRQLYILGTNRA